MRIFTLVFRPLFIVVVTIQASVSQIIKDDFQVPKVTYAQRLTFEGGVLYAVEDIGRGFEDMWRASMHIRSEASRENLGLFTTKGLLVMPNQGNSHSSVLGSLKFLNTTIDKAQTKVVFKGEELEILGMVHTHPDAFGVSEHAPFEHRRFEWQWTEGKIGNYVIANDGIYRAQLDYLTSKWIGYNRERTYQLIIRKYFESDNGL